MNGVGIQGAAQSHTSLRNIYVERERGEYVTISNYVILMVFYLGRVTH